MKRTWRPACGVRRLVELLVALVVVMLATFAAAVVSPGGQPSSEATSTYDLASSIYDVSQRFSSATVDGTGMRRGSSSRPNPVAREGSEVVPRFVLAAKGADEGISGGRYLFNNWHKSTFPNRTQSVNYHAAQHGNGRSAVKYTQDAMDFFAQNRSMGVPVTLRDGTAGIKIATKQPLPGGGVQKVGGYWTSDGRLVTYWD